MDKTKKLGLVFLFGFSLFLAYVWYFFAPYYFPRYLFPLVLIFLFCLLVLIDLCFETVNRRLCNVWFIIPLIAGLLIMIFPGGFTRFYISKTETCCGYMNMGLWANENLQPGSIVASCQSGALSYFADNLIVINLDGVVNKPCYEALKRKQVIEYIKEQKIKFVLGWVVNFDFLSKQATNYQKTDFIQIDKILDFKSWDQYWYVTMVNYDNLDSLSEWNRH